VFRLNLDGVPVFLGDDMKSGKFFAGAALLSAGAVNAFAVYGIGVNASSSDTFWTTVVNVGGGSGTIISRNWVLTARHVTGNVTFNGAQRTTLQRIEHPTADLALLRVNYNFPTWTPIISSDVLGSETTIVGFGHSGTPRTNSTGYLNQSGFGTRRAITNTIGLSAYLTVNYNFGQLTYRNYIADLDTHLPETPAPYDADWLGDGGATANEGSVNNGDSGGAWMVQTAQGWRLAAVTTVKLAVTEVPPGATETASSKYFAFGMSGSAGVDLSDPVHRDWVLSTVPEPGTFAIVGVGIAALLRRRRK
jgi:hypothetical protein